MLQSRQRQITPPIFRAEENHPDLPHRHLCAGAHKPQFDHARLWPCALPRVANSAEEWAVADLGIRVCVSP